MPEVTEHRPYGNADEDRLFLEKYFVVNDTPGFHGTSVDEWLMNGRACSISRWVDTCLEMYRECGREPDKEYDKEYRGKFK